MLISTAVAAGEAAMLKQWMTGVTGETPGYISPTTVFVAKHRIRVGETILYRTRAQPPTSTGTFEYSSRIVYDDGTTDDFTSTYVNTSTTAVNPWASRDVLAGQRRSGTDTPTGVVKRATKNGYVVALSGFQIAGTTFVRGEAYFEAFISSGDQDVTLYRDVLCRCYLYGVRGSAHVGLPSLDKLEDLDFISTLVFQGTVTEDATVGTHVCTLTVTGVAGTEFQVVYGLIRVGNTTTAQTASVIIDDGTNEITFPHNANLASTTTASSVFVFGSSGNVNASANLTAVPFIVSGTMRLILRVSTTAVSVTQTFAVVLRIKGRLPAFTLNDTVGTSTNTTNTETWFT